jgi:micrococcal nuclease
MERGVARQSVAGVALFALLAGLVAGCTDDGASGSGGDGLGVVVAVVDGDTIDVRLGGRDERVRLIGIDTPETKRPNTPVECFGPEASAFIASLLPVGTKVRIERDVVGRDDYGRLLGYVHLDTAGDGDTAGDDDQPVERRSMFVNLEIVRRGYAQPMSIPPNTTHADDFARAARAAEADDIGMWAACS